MSGVIGTHSYTIEPAAPNGFEEVRVRIDSVDGCYRGIAVARPFLDQRVLRLVMGGSDAGVPNCPEFTPTYRTFGVVPRGTYTLVVYSCVSNPPPPHPQCVVHETRTFYVGGGSPVQVPGLSACGALLLAIAVSLVAIRRHRAGARPT